MDSAAALPAQARPVSHSGPLETDYPACGVPQCIMAATKPRVVIPGRLWEVHAGLPMEAFWCAHGPAGVTLYNFAMPSTTGARQPTRKRKPLAMVKQHHARFRTAADTLQLTEAGQAQHDDTVVWAETYACKGDGNCLKRRGKCSVTVHITATRKQARDGLWSVLLGGSHVAKGSTAEPPARLRMSRLCMAWALDKAACGQPPVVVATQNRAEVGPSGSGKHVVRRAQLARAKEYRAALCRGVASTDAERTHRFVMEVLVPRQLVLLYRPHASEGGFSLVLATPWSLARGRCDGWHFVTMDAKHDTQEAGQLRWSSFRCTADDDHGRIGIPITVQIADRENEETIKEFALATRAGIACREEGCTHGWGPFTRSSCGTWHRGRLCSRSAPLYTGTFPLVPAGGRDPTLVGAPGPQAEPTTTAAARAANDKRAVWQPVVCHDKHRACFLALYAVGLASRLDDWHDYKSVDQQCKEAKITGTSAIAAKWSLRLLKRTSTAEHTLRVFHVVAEQHLLACKLSAPPWTIETAHKLNRYFRMCWVYPAPLRQCWTDAAGAGVLDFCRTTCGHEASHAYWEKHIARRMTLKLASEVVQLTVGLDLLGTPKAGFFDDAMVRWEGAAAAPEPSCTSAHVREARACCAFLQHGTDLVTRYGAGPECPEAGGIVQRFPPGPDLRAHAHEPARGGGNMPPWLQPALAAVAHGGPLSAEAEEGHYAVHGKTLTSTSMDSVYRGAYSATGLCKYGRYFEWCRACRTAPSGHSSEAVAERWCKSLHGLAHFVYERERSKPAAGVRVDALYNVGKQALDSHKSAMAGHENACKRRQALLPAAEALLQALLRHASVPPTGHGGSALAAGSLVQPPREWDVQFSSTADVGFVFSALPGGGGLHAEYAIPHGHCGAVGPQPLHPRTRAHALHAGHTITHVCGVPAAADMLEHPGGGTLSSSLGDPGAPLVLRIRQEGGAAQAAPPGPRRRKRTKHSVAEPTLGGQSGARAAKPRNKGAEHMRTPVLPKAAHADVEAAVAALPALLSPQAGARGGTHKRPPTSSPGATTAVAPTGSTTAVASWRNSVKHLMSQITAKFFGSEELEAMASLGGASGKAWSIS